MARCRHAIDPCLLPAPCVWPPALCARPAPCRPFPPASAAVPRCPEADVAVPVSATTAPSTPPCITARCSASEYSRSPPRTRITEGAAGFAALLPAAFWPCVAPAPSPVPHLHCCYRARPARAQQHRPHRLAGSLVRAISVCRCWLSTISGAGHGIRLLPQPRMPAKCCLAGRLVQLRLGGNHVRRPIAAQRHAALACSAARSPPPFRQSPADRAALACPGRLHVAVRKRIARLLRYIHFVRGQLQAAILDARADRSGAATRPRPHTPLCRPWRAAAAAACRQAGLSPPAARKSTTCPSSSADLPHPCASVVPLGLAAPGSRFCALRLGRLVPVPVFAQNSLPAGRPSPFAAPLSPWSAPSRVPAPVIVRSVESARRTSPVTSSAVIFAGAADRIAAPALACNRPPRPCRESAPVPPESCLGFNTRKSTSATGERQVRRHVRASLPAGLPGLRLSLCNTTPRSRCAWRNWPWPVKSSSAVGEVPCTVRPLPCRLRIPSCFESRTTPPSRCPWRGWLCSSKSIVAVGAARCPPVAVST